MAFNLEFKITYDELAPSLQDMFKSLQSQITDNRNEITDINIDIEDIANEINNINQEITNIKNDITNIENDITKIENNIQNIKNTITDIENTITEIEGDITNIEETVNIIQGMTADGEHGQVVKIDKNSEQKGALFADDNFHEMLVFENDSEIEEFKKSYDYNVSMQEIFNTWQQNLCVDRSMYTLGLFKDRSTNVNFQIKVNSKDSHWKFRDDLGAIQMSYNQSWYSMFISKEIYPIDSYIEIYIEGIEKDDDDLISIIFGYKQDNDSSFHTLEFVSTGNHQNQCNYKSWVTYDMGQPTCKLLLSQPLDSNFNTSTGTGRSKMKIVKTSNSVTVSRAKFYNSESAVLSAPYDYTATYTLPTTKPNDWDQTTYNNIKTMFGSSKLGFGTFSWNCIFKIISSNTGIMSESLYNLNTDSIQSYKDGQWITSSDKVSDVIPYRVFLYNDYNDTLFFYYYKQTYCKIATSGDGAIIDSIVASGSEGQILKIHNNGITPDNNFRVLRVVDNDEDFNTEASQGRASTVDVFNKWGRYSSFNNAQCQKYIGEPDSSYGHTDGQNMDANGNRKTMWSLSDNVITNNRNLNSCDIFVSNELYGDYELEALCNRLNNNGDDDYFGIVLGFQNISSNKFNYVILLRCDCFQNGYNKGQSTTKRYWIIAYNWMCPDAKIIVDHTEMLYYQGGPATQAGRYCKLYMKKDAKTFTCQTSNNYNTTNFSLSDATKFTWTMPDTKPSDWTDDMWENMNVMIRDYSYTGFGVQSQPCSFTLTATMFSDLNRIYRLDTDEIYEFNDTTSSFIKTSDTVSSVIPFHSWLYNKTTKKLFNYSGKQNYTLIDH